MLGFTAQLLGPVVLWEPTWRRPTLRGCCQWSTFRSQDVFCHRRIFLLRPWRTPDTMYSSGWSKIPRVALESALWSLVHCQAILASSLLCHGLPEFWEVAAATGLFHFGFLNSHHCPLLKVFEDSPALSKCFIEGWKILGHVNDCLILSWEFEDLIWALCRNGLACLLFILWSRVACEVYRVEAIA